jgi:hypothetical protein
MLEAEVEELAPCLRQALLQLAHVQLACLCDLHY